MKIALAMIIKSTDDEAALLDQCLTSVHEHVDGIFLLVNHKPGIEPSKKVLEVVEKYTNNFNVQEWTNFGDMRRQNFAMVPKEYDFIVWCDADDVWSAPEKLHQVALATPKHITGIYMCYEYQHDEFGNVTVPHYVARMVRNDGSFAWSGKILHESLEPVRHCGKAINEEVRVIHMASEERRDKSLERNIIELEKELEGEGDMPDPRTLFYLGSAYIDAGRLDEAKELLQGYLKLSGWAEERAQAWVHLGNIYEYEDDRSEMRNAYLHALLENPKDPTPYVELAKVEMIDKLWAKAVEWLQMALKKKPDPMTTTIGSSSEVRYRAYMYLADCYLNEGGKWLDDSYKYAKKALDMRPDKVTREYFEMVEKLIQHRDMTEGAKVALKYFEENDKTKIMPYIETLPDILQDNPLILRYKKRNTPPKVWAKKSIVIFCGNSVMGEWGPWSLAEGIGGSEEAIVRLGEKLKDRGWDVWVYSTPGARAGDYNGVHYRNYWEMNLADTFDVFVAWRSPWFFDIEIKANKKYLWLHDAMEPEEFPEERLKNLDKVIVLSKYHRSLFPNIPEDKIMYSANGIDPEDFEMEDNKHLRDPHRIVYMSSHVRGLQMLYGIWEDVKKEVPDATLDVYYGWDSYDNVNKDNPERRAWKEMMVKWEKDLDGVTDWGKIGQQQIVEEIQKAGVWAYPCPFPEIFCITAIKAQAGGAVPVSSDFAALAETVSFGTKIHMSQVNDKTTIGQWKAEEVEAFKNALIETLKNSEKIDRKEMMRSTRERWSWASVAKQWEDEFNDPGTKQ